MVEEYLDDELEEILTQYMYSYHLMVPEEWDESGLEECCLDTLPRKITADESYYRSIAPVLSSFFKFSAEKGFLSNASNLARQVNKIDKQIVKNSSDSSRWGMAKNIINVVVEMNSSKNKESQNHEQ
jgi:hypothetical protein